MASFLESLLSVPTVSGGEKALTDKIDRYIKKYTDECIQAIEEAIWDSTFSDSSFDSSDE